MMVPKGIDYTHCFPPIFKKKKSSLTLIRIIALHKYNKSQINMFEAIIFRMWHI